MVFADPSCGIMSKKYVLFRSKIKFDSLKEYQNKEVAKIVNNYISLQEQGRKTDWQFRMVDEFIEALKKDPNKSEKISMLVSKRDSFVRYPGSILKQYMELIQSGKYEFLACIGHILNYGIGVDQDVVEAWAWYDAAFAQHGGKLKDITSNIVRELTDVEFRKAVYRSDQIVKEYTTVTDRPTITIIQ